MAINLAVKKSDFVFKIAITGEAGKTEFETIDIREALKINHQDLTTEIVQQPAAFAWFSALQVDQEDKLAKKEEELAEHRADISLKFRQGKVKLTDNAGNEIRTTDKTVEDYVTNDPRTQAYKEEIQELETICKKLKVLVSGSMQRKDMLVGLGLLARQELKNNNLSGF